jgi:hypothetical protein
LLPIPLMRYLQNGRRSGELLLCLAHPRPEFRERDELPRRARGAPPESGAGFLEPMILRPYAYHMRPLMEFQRPDYGPAIDGDCNITSTNVLGAAPTLRPTLPNRR